MTNPTPESKPVRLASATYLVEFTHTRSIFDRIQDHVGAYSAADAEARVRARMACYEVTIHRVELLDALEPVVCTYAGPAGDGPWQWLNYVDPYGPVVVCDVHQMPAQPCVYDSDQDLAGDYEGPCQYHPDVLDGASMTGVSVSTGLTTEEVGEGR